MREFFRGWRRKIGVVTLLMACMFAAGWVGSLIMADDEIRGLSFGGEPHFQYFDLALMRGVILVITPDDHDWKFDFSQIEVVNISKDVLDVHWSWHFCWLGWGKNQWHYLLAIPFWSIVIPLTLLSVWLLLSKPRAGKAEPVPAEQTST